MASTATKTCEQCGSTYLRHRSFGREQWAVSRFCSRQCRGKSITGIQTGPKPEIRIGKEIPLRFVGNGAVMVGRKNPDFVATDGRKIAVEVFYRRHKERFSGGLESWRSNRETEFRKQRWKLFFFDETQVNAEHVKAVLGGVL